MDTPTAPTSGLTAIPDNGLLLHVGVFKTGTTALQEALRAAPKKLVKNDVFYRGPASWQWKTLLGLLESDKPGGPWQELEQGVRGHTHRAMVSSENLCGATPEQAKEVVSRLGAGRPVTVLITVRSLSGLLASTWQQLLKRGMTMRFEDWLQQIFDNPGSTDVLFWRRNDFPAQLRKWGSLVGEENVVLAVSDKRFPDRNLQIVEQLLGIPQGTVKMRPDIRSNRSMSFAEAELLRNINLTTADEISREAYRRLIRLGAFPGMYKADIGGDQPIPVPRWAAEAASAIGAEQSKVLKQSRAVLVGDMDALAESKWDVDGPVVEPETVNMATAVAALTGAILAGDRRSQKMAEQAGGNQHPGRLRQLLKRA